MVIRGLIVVTVVGGLNEAPVVVVGVERVEVLLVGEMNVVVVKVVVLWVVVVVSGFDVVVVIILGFDVVVVLVVVCVVLGFIVGIWVLNFESELVVPLNVIISSSEEVVTIDDIVAVVASFALVVVSTATVGCIDVISGSFGAVIYESSGFSNFLNASPQYRLMGVSDSSRAENKIRVVKELEELFKVT